jgi:hypothetical protein
MWQSPLYHSDQMPPPPMKSEAHGESLVIALEVVSHEKYRTAHGTLNYATI